MKVLATLSTQIQALMSTCLDYSDLPVHVARVHLNNGTEKHFKV